MELKQGYKKTEVGVIPEDWDVKSLGEIGENIIGLTYSPNNVREYGHLVLRSSNIQNNKLAFENNVFVDMKLPNRVIVKEEDILICVRNGSKHLIGKCALIDKATEGSAFGAFMSVYRTPYAKYIFHQFQSNIIQKQIDEVMGATINQLTNKNLASFNIPLPKDILEQNVIASTLSEMDALISQTEKLIEKKKAIKQGAMQELLKPKEGWVTKKLGELLKYEQPTAYIVADTEYHPNNETPVLTAGKSFILGYTNETNNIFENTPVVIFDDFTTSCQYVDFRFKVKSSAMKILKPANDNVNMRFAFEVLKSIKYQVGDHKRHWIGEFINFEVIIPSKIEEQNRIGQIIEDIEKEQQSYQVKLTKLKQQKQGMMQALLTGKIRLVS
jgi:type I restriction enzyme S subunit